VCVIIPPSPLACTMPTALGKRVLVAVDIAGCIGGGRGGVRANPRVQMLTSLPSC
jgi:hypothetical protein